MGTEPNEAELKALGRALWKALTRGMATVTVVAEKSGKRVPGKTKTYVVTVTEAPSA